MSARAYLGLGGNIGDPVASMRAALDALDAREDTSVARVSKLYRTPPWGKTDQPDFINACAAVDTTLSPRDLLDLCLATEKSLKRERAERWGPRTIDIDLLDYAGHRIEEAGLVLPHPRMTARAFVLVPLADVAPSLLIEGRTVEALIAGLDRQGIEAVAGTEWWRRSR